MFRYTDYKAHLLSLFNVARLDCPELLMSGEEQKIREEVWLNVSITDNILKSSF